jgi:uncharacterized membrane protein
LSAAAAVVAAVAAASKPGFALRRRQRGAVAVIVAIALVALLTATMLAIETGHVYSSHRQFQKAATLAALDAARVVSGCSATPTLANLNNAVSSSLTANGFPAASLTTVVTETGTIQTSAGNLRSLLPTASIDNAKAARVTLTAPFPAPFLPLFNSSGSMTVSATAAEDAVGSLRVGSGVAAVNGGVLNSLLSGLVGGNVSLSVADFNGLANVNVTATQLATALGVSVTDLSDPLKLQTTTPVLSSALNGLAGSLSGTASKQVTDSLKNLAGQSTNNTPIPLGSILGPAGSVASDVPFLNLQDLIMALALASQADASGVKTIELKNLGLDVPGVATVKVFAKVLQPPQLSGLGRAGQTQASTAQIKLLIRIDAGALLTGLLGNLTGLVNGLLGGLGTANVVVAPAPLNIGIDVNVAKATAFLNRLDCPRSGVNNGQPTAGLNVNTALATVDVGTFSGSASAAPPLNPATTSWPLATVTINTPLNLLGSTTLHLGLALTSANVSSTSRNLNDVYQFTSIPTTDAAAHPVFRANGAPGLPTVPVASPSTENPQTVGSATSVGVTLGLTSSQTGGGLLGALTGLVNSLVTTITTGPTSQVQSLLTAVNGLVASLINPLLDLLGVKTGTATTTMDLVTVGPPVIITTALP